MNDLKWGNKQEVTQAMTEVNEDDYKLRADDLRQENNMLRQELSILYTKYLTNHLEQNKKEYADGDSQTDDFLLLKVPMVEEKLVVLTSELSHQKSLNIEQAHRAKEADRKIHTLELKILDMNLEILQAAPIKAKIEELTTLTELQRTKLSSATNEYLNLTVEINHHKGTIESLARQLGEKNDTITELLARITQTEEKLTETRKQVGHKESQLESALYLNTEYQAKLHKDDLQFLKWSGELNHYERKCESQSKEILRLSDKLDLASLQIQQAEKELNSAKAEKKQAASISAQKVTIHSGARSTHARSASCVPTSRSTDNHTTSTASAHRKSSSTSSPTGKSSGTSTTNTSQQYSPGYGEALDVEDCVCSFFGNNNSITGGVGGVASDRSGNTGGRQFYH